MNETTRPELYHIREDTTGHMLSWGSGEFCQHGHGCTKVVHFLNGAVQRFCSSSEYFVKLVGCGSSHTAVVTNSGELYLWGNGNSGQLGTSDLTTKLEPQKLNLYANQSESLPIAGVACGGRHTIVWLESGQVFGFGNNFHGQLGFDNKENQTHPILLKFPIHKQVVQVACGDRHTIFRFTDGGVACTGNNTHGQIGSGSRKDVAIPCNLSDFSEPLKTIAAGSQHSLAVTESGQIYVWGYGIACGNHTDDVLSPLKLITHRQNVIAVAGGCKHSMALTANGSVYTWGSGSEGQLGHGEKVKFLSRPRRVKDRHVSVRCIQICSAEMFSSAVTEKGLLYMWGKNSHTIMPDLPTSHKVFLPFGINKNFRGGRILKVFCGSWHAVAIIGRPELLVREEESSGESEQDTTTNTDGNDVERFGSENGRISDEEITTSKFERLLEREKTTVSIADFYAPTPDINKSLHTPSPVPNWATNHNVNNQTYKHLNSGRPAATMIVQTSHQPMTTYVDVATSPMTLTSTSSPHSSNATNPSRAPSPVAELSFRKFEKHYRKISRPEKRFNEHDPKKYEREKFRISTTPVSEVIRLSKTPANAFILPRDPSGISMKQVDFSEMEEIRLKGSRSSDKFSRLIKHRETKEAGLCNNREPSPFKFKDHIQTKIRDSGHPKSKLRYVDSWLSGRSDSILMESPLFKGTRRNVTSETDRNLWEPSSISTDEKYYRHHVPKQKPRKYNKSSTFVEANFGLHISRSETIMAPLQIEVVDSSDRLAQLKRYAATHNPPITARTEEFCGIKSRHVSIPGGRNDSQDNDKEELFIGVARKEKPTFSSCSSWKVKSDIDRFAPRKMRAAEIFQMYLAKNNQIGSVENPLYTSFSDGRGHSDDLFDSDTFIIQPLLKRQINNSNESTNVKLSKFDINHGTNNALPNQCPTLSNTYCLEDDEMDLTIGATPRVDLIESRVS